MAQITTVLVTGAGTLLGQGILRSLHLCGRPLRIVTADPDARAAGHWLGDVATLVPFVTDPGYLAVVEGIIERERIDVVLIGTDVELAVLSAARRRLEREHGVHILVCPPEVVEIADDKWCTATFLAEEVGFPLFAKPRRGARSVGARAIETSAVLAAACAAEPSLIVQEMLSGEAGEYTAGAIVLEGKCRSVVVLRRDLREGNTFRAYYERANSDFAPFIAHVAEALGVHGPCNFQFRLRDREPVIFEINARFSGTTPLRAFFGFNEVSALLDWLIDGTAIPEPRLREGVVLRTTSDLYLDREQVDQLRAAVPFVLAQRRLRALGLFEGAVSKTATE